MQSSLFNVRVPLADIGASVNAGNDVFLLNTFTDAQLVVSSDVASLLDRLEGVAADGFNEEERRALETLSEHGFVVGDRAEERRELASYFHQVREGNDELRVTLLTTLQCNFACGYCFQGDHGDYNKFAEKMSLDTAARVAEWIEDRMDATATKRFVLMFFGGEPLLNLPIMYYLAQRLWASAQSRGITMVTNIITNGLLLTPDVVDRLQPYGLNAVKITLDGDRDTHNRMRPLRGGQGTFDKIIANIRKIAGRCQITIGGNFDETSVESYPALIEYLASQDFASAISRVNFKPVIRETPPPPASGGKRKFIGLTPIGDGGTKPLNGTCMTSAGMSAAAGACDTCHFLDDHLAYLRDETRKAGFNTSDGVHMGPCEIHRKHAYTIGPDGDLYACPGFTGDKKMTTGHISGHTDAIRSAAARRFDQLAAWKQCQDCAFIPVCAGGCTVASHTELGDMNIPNCHKKSFEAGVVSMARDAAASRLEAVA